MNQASPQIIVIAGPNGAGKTTLAPTLLRDTFGLLEFVNADAISSGLSAFNPEAASLNAGRIMLRTLQDLAKKRESFAFESTLATRSYTRWIVNLRQTGYEFHLFFLWLRSVELAIERVKARARGEGHTIPEDVIRRRYHRSASNFFNLYLPIARTWVVYDNSTVSPILVAAGRENEIERVVRQDLWQPLIDESDERTHV